jgi:hypothetical protein
LELQTYVHSTGGLAFEVEYWPSRGLQSAIRALGSLLSERLSPALTAEEQLLSFERPVCLVLRSHQKGKATVKAAVFKRSKTRMKSD